MAFATDDFNRADSGSLGSNWTEHTNGMKIVSNKADTVNSGGTRQLVSWNAASFGGDQYSQVVTQAGMFASYVCARVQGTGSGQDAHVVYWGDGFGTNIFIGYLVDNSLTTLLDTGVTWAGGDTIRIESEGSNIRAYKNGAQAGTTQTDGGLITGGAPGFGGGWTGFDIFDNWEGGDLSAGSTPSPAAGALTLAGQGTSLGFTIHMPDEA